MAYSTILNTVNVPIGSKLVINFISRLIDLDARDDLPVQLMKHIKENSGVNWEGLSENQFLFSLHATRVLGLDDLEELLDALDALDEEKRNTLLAVCNSSFDFAGLLVDGAWYKETIEGEIDVPKAIKILRHTVDKGRKWNKPALARAAFVAMSVIWDEYGHSYENALKVIEQARNEFPDDPKLSNQLAKILFHNKEFERSLKLGTSVIENPGDLSVVEAVYTCRSAGICAARLDDWLQAEELFQKGAERAKQTKVLDLMAVGLKADAAFARWKQGRRKESVELYAQVLGELESVPVTDDPYNRHLHATVRHCIAWTQNNIGKQNQPHQVEPHPGFCSNQEPHESMKDLQILPTKTVWGLLAGTEIRLGLNLGISKIAKQKMGVQPPTMILINNRFMAFNGIWERLDFDDFVTCLVGFYEAAQFSSALRQTGTDIWEARQIPHLPEAYWQDQSNREALHHHFIAAAVVMTARMAGTAIPVDRWRRDMFELGIFSVETERLLHFLSTDRTEATKSLYDHAAYAVSLLRAEAHPAPRNLFMCFFLAAECARPS